MIIQPLPSTIIVQPLTYQGYPTKAYLQGLSNLASVLIMVLLTMSKIFLDFMFNVF